MMRIWPAPHCRLGGSLTVRSIRLLCLPIAIGVLAGCGGPSESGPEPAADHPPWSMTVLDTPAAPGSGEPNLALAADGSVLLSWIERDGEQHRLRFARRETGGQWSEAREIVRGDDWFVNWADFPSMAAAEDGTLYAHWLQMSGEAVYSYDVRVGWSKDGGETWSEPITPHDDGTKTEHGFVSMVPESGDRVSLVWLDGRDTAGASEAGHSSGAQMTIRYGVLDSNGAVTDPALLDDRVCDCCQTSAARTADGLVAVFRDRSETEVRDISFVRSSSEGWSTSGTVAADGWEINGCPVNGPSVAAIGKVAVAVWFGAPGNEPHVRAAFSQDAGQTWDAPIRVDDGRPIGRVDVVLLDSGEAVVSWMEQVEDGAEVRIRTIDAQRRRGDPLTVADSSTARSTGFPRMQRSGSELVIAWRDSSDPPLVRTAVVTRGS